MRIARTFGVIACLCLAGCASAGQAAEPAGDTTQRRVRVDVATPTFTADVVHGSITIAGHDEPYIELLITRRTTAPTDEDRALADREVRLDIVEHPDGVSLCASMPYRTQCDEPEWERNPPRRRYRVAFDIVAKVPRHAMVTAKLVDGPTIRLTDLDGRVNARHVNGGIEASGLSQGGRLHTVNGDIALTLPQDPGAKLEAETVNGDIVAQFPKTLSGDFWIASAFGRVYSEFDVTRLPPTAPVADRSDGHLRYRFDRAFGIRVGQGGPAHRFTTLNGDICIVARGQ